MTTVHRAPVLIIDDDASVCEALTVLLKDDFEVRTAATGGEGLTRLAQEPIPLVLLELRLPGMPGLEVLQHIKTQASATAVIVLSALHDVTTVVHAIHSGAVDFLPKPYDGDLLRTTLHQVLTQCSYHHPAALPPLPAACDGQAQLLGQSVVMQRLRAQICQAAATTATVLITGESGVGKELVARAVHQQSSRKHQPFLSLNCAAIPDELLASTFFGHTRGAFTGAVKAHRGVFERAHTGTLFLDEVGSLSLSAQVHLLRTLEDQWIVPLGGETGRAVDVRVVAATNQKLEQLVATHAFRTDLLYRLHIVPLHVPPLRQRRSDIPLLVAHFLRQYTTAHHRQVTGLAPAALQVLRQYAWPGNVRELAHIIERLVVLSTQPLLEVEAVQAALAP